MSEHCVYLQDTFLDYFLEKEKQHRLAVAQKIHTTTDDDQKTAALIALKNILLNSKVYTDLLEQTLIKLCKKYADGNKNYDTYKDFFYLTLIKNYKISRSITDFSVNNTNAFYGLNMMNDAVKKIESEYGVLVKGVEDNFDNFNLKLNKNIELSADFKELIQLQHSANQVIIIDPYFFSNAGDIDKIVNYKKAIDNLCPKCKQVIVFATSEMDKPKAYAEIAARFIGLFNNNKKVSLFLLPERKFHDRFILTNYMICSIQNPTNIKQTYLSSDFIFSKLDKYQLENSLILYQNMIKQMNSWIAATKRAIPNMQGSFGYEISEVQ